MSHSLSFDDIDLSAYGLTVLMPNAPDFRQQSESQLIQDRSWPFRPKYPPKMIQLSVAITAVDRATLDGYLDSIKSVLVTDDPEKLELDSYADRYWLAKLVSFTGSYGALKYWGGTIVFIVDDPIAYDVSETSSDFNIDADPDTVVEAVGGTAKVNPVYTLTAGEALNDVTIKVENLFTGEELQWTGSLADTEELEIDVDNWVVKKEGVADMSTVTGQFPRLIPGINNSIKVTGFSTTGDLNIKYRDRYL